ASGERLPVRAEPAAASPGGAIYVGPTHAARESGMDPATLGPEEWIVRAKGDRLLLAGGRPRGTLYAVYHFLEDVVGVHWWNPWEEFVPERPTIEIRGLDRRGRPTFRYRDIYMLYGNDGGRFAARSRLNRQGDAPISPEYGGCMDYGPPYHVHTFYKYVSPDVYFDEHPEYFSLIKDKRTADRAQLCLTNPQLRDLFVEKLKANIERARARAKEREVPPPVVFDISQNDWTRPCECDRCQAIAKAEGSEAGPLLDFLNYIADAIEDDYPDVYIDTLAYQYTQQPPRTIRPRDNVIIRLCDTTSNFTRAITDPENAQFRDVLVSWSKIAKNLRIWDYAVTYAKPRGLPMPSVHTYQSDYRFYAEHNVQGVFTEHEFPVIADMRDLKVWMMMKLLEDPYRDYGALLRTFTDGFYGAAGPHIREYLHRLRAASAAKTSYISMGASPPAFKYLDFDFVSKAMSVFDRAEQAVGDDPVLLRRVRHARLSLDRAAVILYRRLSQQWAAKGKEPETMPLDRDAIARRCKATWYAEIDRRLPESRRKAAKQEADAELLKYTALPPHVRVPKKFSDLPPGAVLDFTADVTRNWKDIVKVVRDDEAESGITNRLEFPTKIDTDRHPVDRYRLPMPWGLYDVKNKRSGGGSQIKPEDVPGPGYHWYKMGTFRVGPSHYLYFFWSWIIQVDLDAAFDPDSPEQKFHVWARIKFEGPAFPHGKPGDKNAISVERVVLVKAGAG
ncbi:MAG: DUF4838 domain-containing protein, partial [Armatimonadota bacterium]